MFIPITQELANTSPDEFEIQLEDAIPGEGRQHQDSARGPR
ncbi:MAG: hypothetical protein R3B09_05685 [Nannocystaceae bacterium]